ncbi:MAG: hypothetical protein ACKE5M_08670 [Methylophilaceae bacterium]
MSLTGRSARLTAVLLLVLAYSALANYTLLSKQNPALGALVAMSPIMVTFILLALRSKRRVLMLGLIILISPLFWLVWSQIKAHYDVVYWLVHESLQFVLLVTFARTLTPDQQPLCAQFAQIVHSTLSPELTDYTRKVTIAWSLFFACVMVMSTFLFFTYPIRVWSIFANFFYLPLVALMFIVEYWVRKRTLPAKDLSNMMEAVHAFTSRPRN